MSRLWCAVPAAVLVAALTGLPAPADDKAKDDAKAPVVHPAAVLAFGERGTGAKDLGPKVTDLLFAKLAGRPDLVLVDRTDLGKVLDELRINAGGLVKPDEAARVGRLTGARVLVTGSVVHADKKLYLVAKVIGTETSRVIGASVEGQQSDDLGDLVGKLADKVGGVLEKQADRLVPRPAAPADRAEALAKKLGKGPRPSVMVRVTERHIGAPAIDPAAQTEVMRYAKAAGFELLDPETAGVGQADVLVSGEGFSEVAGRTGGLITVRARVELKAVDRKTGRVLAADRQTAIVVEASEHVAGKQALEDAAATLAERVLPKLVAPEKK